MKIAVCLKQILDPELPSRVFEVDEGTKRPRYGEHPLVINPFDENALEMALQLKESDASRELTALSMGGEAVEEVLRKALALMLDKAVLIKSGEVDLDSCQAAQLLGECLKQTGPYDLILFGRQAGDWERGQVGAMVAEHLNMPNINNVYKVEPGESGEATLWRDLDGEIQKIKGRLPMVVTATNSPSNVLRSPKVKNIMQAYSKDIMEVGADEPVPGLKRNGQAKIVDLYKPERKTVCEFVKGDSAQELADNLIKKLCEMEPVKII